MAGEQSYPLQWPEGWPWTPPAKRTRGEQFKHKAASGWRELVTFAVARDALYDELRKLGATNVVVSTNHKPDRYGVPTESKKPVADEGVAIYFLFKEKGMAMACDRFDNAAANMRSLGLAIDAMRQLDRHGGGAMMERAFSGFLAIAPPTWKKPWRQVFGVDPEWHGDIKALYREKAKNRHPDSGGSDSLMAELNVAFDEARDELDG